MEICSPSSRDSARAPLFDFLVAVALAVPVFVLDLVQGPYVALAVLYAGAVLYALRAPGRAPVLGIAVLCTILSIVGAVVPPIDFPDWQLIGQNRATVLIAIWATGLVGLRLRDLTLASRRQQLKLLNSERRFRTIFNTVQDPVFVYEIGPDGHPLEFAEANEAAANTYGYSREELRAMKPAQLISAPGVAERLPEYIAQLPRESSFLLESEHITRDGRRIPVEVRLQRVEWGERETVLNVTRDISARKRREQALQESEQREKARADELEALMDAVPAVVMIARDPDCRQITGSRLAYELLGVPEGSNLCLTAPSGEGPTGFKLLDANGRELSEHEHPMRRAAAGEAVRGHEHIIEHDDGSRRYLYGDAIPLRDETGRTRGALAARVDITEHKEVQLRLQRLTEKLEERVAARTAELAESERLYRSIGEQIEYGIWITNPDGGVRYLSESWLDLVGMTQEEAADFGWADRLPPDQKDRILAEWREAVATQDRWSCELQIRGQDGQYRTVLERGRPIRDDDGRVTAWAGIDLDITERKANERRLQQLTVQLSQAEQRERRRLSEILHDDVQQMLVAVKMRLGKLKDAERELSSQVDRVTDLLDETIESTRTLSHELSPQILQTGGLGDALRWLAMHKYEKLGLRLHVEADDSAEPAPEVKTLIFQAVRELLLNVAKHAGVSAAEITLSPDGANHLCITVSDEGAGFAVEAERARSGAGAHLGLFGIYERLEALGGSMEVESSPGHGTTVRLLASLDGVPAADDRATPHLAGGNTAAD